MANKVNLIFFKNKRQLIAYDICLFWPSIARFSGIDPPLIQGGVIRFKDKKGVKHVRSVLNYYDIAIEEIK